MTAEKKPPKSIWLQAAKNLPTTLKAAAEIKKMTGKKPLFNLLFGSAVAESAIKPISSEKKVLAQVLLANKTIMALDEAIENNIDIGFINNWWLNNEQMRDEIEKLSESMRQEVEIEKRIKGGERIRTEEYLNAVGPANAVQLLGTSFATAIGEDDYLDTEDYKKKIDYVNFKIRLMADFMKYPKDKKDNKPNVLSVATGEFGEMNAIDLIKIIEEKFLIENPFEDNINEAKTSDFLLNFYELSMKFLEDLTPLWHSIYHFKPTDIVSPFSVIEDKSS